MQRLNAGQNAKHLNVNYSFFIQKCLNNEITGEPFQAAPQMGFQYPSQQQQQYVQQQQQHYQQQQQGPIRNEDSKESF